MRYRCKRCNNGLPSPRGVLFEADEPVCPSCGANGGTTVFEIQDVHLLVMGEGPILGSFGLQFVACQRNRAFLAEHPLDVFSASDDPRAVTCRSCQGTKWYQELAANIPEIREAERIRKMIEKGSCCG